MEYNPREIAAVGGIWADPPSLNTWQWAEQNIDYSRVRNYDTEWKARYDANYMPYWRQILEWTTDPECREIWVWKCTRCGGSENMLLTTLRYVVAQAPVPTLYIGGQQQSVERFFEMRIKAGFGLSEQTAAAYRSARAREHEIMFPSMDLVATWPANRQAFKQSGYALILADEVSSWPDCSPDLLRERMANYAFPHLIGVSSSDAQQKRSSDNDPIIQEYENTDMCEWMCLDPKTGNRFKFEMGSVDSPYGLKWDRGAKSSDGVWDLRQVYDTAHYITPDGTRIDDKDRMIVVNTGVWTAGKIGLPKRRGARVTRFMVPFSVGSFGHIASAFLSAKEKGGDALRVFIYEYLAERWKEKIDTPRDDAIDQRILEYDKGGSFVECEKIKSFYIGKTLTQLLTVDVQKTHVWWVCRQWVTGGDSGLMDYGAAAMWEEIEAVGNKYKCFQIFVDNSYEKRSQEVLEESYYRKMIPCYGRAQLQMPYAKRILDPFEGKRGQGMNEIGTFTLNPNIFKSLLFDMIMGQSERKWHVYRGVEREYVRQVVAEECVDGEWTVRRGHSQNHMWDCEVLQLFGATFNQLHRLVTV